MSESSQRRFVAELDFRAETKVTAEEIHKALGRLFAPNSKFLGLRVREAPTMEKEAGND